MSRAKVFVHVGAPKTGTTYLQERLARNARSLAHEGVHFPGRPMLGEAPWFHFQAALDLLGEDWGGPSGHAEGAWPAMVKQVRRRTGTVVISHEILAPAPQQKIDRLMSDLDGHDVHIVYTARDLARQVPAGWQESIKQGRSWSYARYLRRVEQGGLWFMRSFDLPTVLNHWAVNLPPENVHVITGPRADAGPDELWLRFCTAIGIDPAWAPEEVGRVNESMSVEHAQVLRRLNARLATGNSRRRDGDLDRLVMSMIEAGVFAGGSGGSGGSDGAGGSRRIQMPPSMHEWADHHASMWIDWLHGSGVHVIGDPEELRPIAPIDETWQDPDLPGPRRMAAVAMGALEAMTREAAARPLPPRPLAPRVRSGISRIASS